MSVAAVIDRLYLRPSSLPEDGWRRAATVILFLCLAVLQGLTPLLHVHLDTVAEDASPGGSQRGVHLPVSLVHAGHAAPGLQAACAGMDDSAVITSPSELKREERLCADAPPVAVHRATNVATLVAVPHGALPEPGPSSGRAPRLRPPSHAPPRIA